MDKLKERAAQAASILSHCTICPHECGVDRTKGETGFCRAGRLASISGYGPHFGEEEVLVGRDGSGTIFFSFCNLRCSFCQNCEISYYGEGEEVDAGELADIMLSLEDRGCANINLVSPSHFSPQILEAVCIARDGGLTVPLLYNTGGYDALPALDLLSGVIDIYMPDIKFGDDRAASRLTGVSDYFSVASRAVAAMYAQVGDLVMDERGVARRGLLVRHLVLPEGLAGTKAVMNFIAQKISPNTFVNIMSQYYPAHLALSLRGLSRPVTEEEYREALLVAQKAGLRRIYANDFLVGG